MEEEEESVCVSICPGVCIELSEYEDKKKEDRGARRWEGSKKAKKKKKKEERGPEFKVHLTQAV